MYPTHFHMISLSHPSTVHGSQCILLLLSSLYVLLQVSHAPHSHTQSTRTWRRTSSPWQCLKDGWVMPHACVCWVDETPPQMPSVFDMFCRHLNLVSSRRDKFNNKLTSSWSNVFFLVQQNSSACDCANPPSLRHLVFGSNIIGILRCVLLHFCVPGCLLSKKGNAYAHLA